MDRGPVIIALFNFGFRFAFPAPENWNSSTATENCTSYALPKLLSSSVHARQILLTTKPTHLLFDKTLLILWLKENKMELLTIDCCVNLTIVVEQISNESNLPTKQRNHHKYKIQHAVIDPEIQAETNISSAIASNIRMCNEHMGIFPKQIVFVEILLR